MREVHLPSPLLKRKETHFTFWRPGPGLPAPKLVIGVFKPGNPPILDGRQDIPLTLAADSDEVWEVDAAACGLTDGQVYHYWFEGYRGISRKCQFRPFSWL